MRIITSQWNTKSSLNTSQYGIINIIMMVSTNIWLYIVFLNTVVFQDYFHFKPFKMDRAAERDSHITLKTKGILVSWGHHRPRMTFREEIGTIITSQLVGVDQRHTPPRHNLKGM